jgi:hypothetical protein
VSAIRPWPALLLAPLVVLGEQALSFALTPLACAAQHTGWLHATAAASLVLAVAFTMTAVGTQRVLGRVALGVGVLSVLTLLALWLPTFVLDPCLG